MEPSAVGGLRFEANKLKGKLFRLRAEHLIPISAMPYAKSSQPETRNIYLVYFRIPTSKFKHHGSLLCRSLIRNLLKQFFLFPIPSGAASSP